MEIVMSFSLNTLSAALRLALVGVFFTLSVGAQTTARAEDRAAGAQTPAEAGDAPAIAAAASLRYALDEISKRFEKETGKSVKLTYGATGNLVHQIEASAPFQALFAADDESVKKLAKAGLTDGEPVVFARGQLSVAAPKGSPVAIDADLKGLKEAIAAGKVKHIAIANPETAPYGRAAREVLKKEGLWDQVQPLLVIGENIGQAATFISTGAADVGFIAQSLAISAELSPKLTSAVVPEAWHEPIDHGLALIKGAGPTAKSFVEFVRGPNGRAVLESGGFSVPTS
jgi:molybdate transport system substrate-binding protein